MRIVFMGTPEIAVASLDVLVKNGYNVVGVITAPDRPAGRGLKLQMSAVKKYALEHNLHVLQPEKLKNPDFLEELRALKADLQVVVAFRMLPEVVWNMPPKGTLNLHASLLPNYRGAAPINWAIINGEKTTGVTTFFLQHDIDTGSIIMQQELPIHDTDTAGDLHDRIMANGAELVLKTVRAIENDNYTAVPQDMSGSYAHAPKIFRDDCKIDWNRPTRKVYDQIRGLSPYPAAWTMLFDKTLKLYQVKPIELNEGEEAPTPGEPLTDGSTWLKFGTEDGYIQVEELQLEGKKRMSTEDFLKGYRF